MSNDLLVARRFFALIATGVLLAAVSACGDTKKTKIDSEPPQREGNSLSPVQAKYNDAAPALSADGTAVAFVSGRESADDAVVRKVFKAEWPAAAAPGAPARATAADLGSETAVAITPDGAWLAIVATAAGATTLYVQDFAGARAAVAVTDDAPGKESPAVSSDSLLLAWVARDADGHGTVKLVALGTGTAADLASPIALTDAALNVDEVFWLPTDAGTYTLGVGGRQVGSGARDYAVRTFNALGDAAAAETVVLATGVVPAPGTMAHGVAGQVLLAKRVPGHEHRQVERIGDIEVTDDAPAPKFNQLSEAVVLDAATGDGTPLTTQPGSQVLSLASGNGTAFAAMRFDYGCTVGGDGRSAGIVLAPLDGSDAAPEILVPKLTAVTARDGEPDGLTFEIAAGFCDKLKVAGDPDSGLDYLDTRLTDIAASASSTAAAFRLAYVTTFSHRFDAGDGCPLKTGDQEVMVIDGSGATRTVYDLSAHRAPLTDAEGVSCAHE